jgi:hypothetical protein
MTEMLCELAPADLTKLGERAGVMVTDKAVSC